MNVRNIFNVLILQESSLGRPIHLKGNIKINTSKLHFEQRVYFMKQLKKLTLKYQEARVVVKQFEMLLST